MANPETVILQNIRLALGQRSDCRIFRNNVGTAKLDDGRVIQFGLCSGSSDLIGWRSVTITPDMVGRTIAQFVAMEIKQPGSRQRVTKQQRAFIDTVNRAGGLASVATSADEAAALLETTQWR